jgi:hypothetical protein
MKLNKCTTEELEGLEGSIVKWARIVEEMKSGNDYPADNGYYDCPLCQLYHPVNIGKQMSEGCSKSCPIKRDTGKDFCDGSPYENWSDSENGGETLENAQAMLDYLLGLRNWVFKELCSMPKQEKNAK